MVGVTARNAVANLAGRLWAAALGFLFVPIYLSYLGPDAYGLVVFHATLLTAFAVLDAGLGSVLTRELSLSRPSTNEQRAASDLSRAELFVTVERLFLLTGLIIGLTMFLAAPAAVRGWLRTQPEYEDVLVDSFRVMGFVICAQWPMLAYQATLAGLERQVEANLIRAAVATFQGLGAVVAMKSFDLGIVGFFEWLLVCQIVGTFVMRARASGPVLREVVQTPQFRLSALQPMWRFALGMAAISALSALLTQADRAVLSRTVPLAELAAYGVAGTLCGVLGMISYPIYSAVLPRLTRVAGASDPSTRDRLYHFSCEVVSAMAFPFWMVVAFFSSEITSLWLGDTETASLVAAILPVLASGSLLNALVTMCYALQVSTSWTRLSIGKNVLTLAISLPALVVASENWGVLGAAWVWFAVNLGYLVVEVPLVHRHLLGEISRSWYARVVLWPLLAVSAVAMLVKHVVPQAGTVVGRATMLIVAGFLAFICCLPGYRNILGEARYRISAVRRRAI